MLVHRPLSEGCPSGIFIKTQSITEQKSRARLAFQDVWKAPTNYKQLLWLLNSVSKLLLENFKTIMRLVKTLSFRNLIQFWLKENHCLWQHSNIPHANMHWVHSMRDSKMFNIYFLPFLWSSHSEVLMAFTNRLHCKLHAEGTMSCLFLYPQRQAHPSSSINTYWVNESISQTILTSDRLLPMNLPSL